MVAAFLRAAGARLGAAALDLVVGVALGVEEWVVAAVLRVALRVERAARRVRLRAGWYAHTHGIRVLELPPLPEGRPLAAVRRPEPLLAFRAPRSGGSGRLFRARVPRTRARGRVSSGGSASGPIA